MILKTDSDGLKDRDSSRGSGRGVGKDQEG